MRSRPRRHVRPCTRRAGSPAAYQPRLERLCRAISPGSPRSSMTSSRSRASARLLERIAEALGRLIRTRTCTFTRWTMAEREIMRRGWRAARWAAEILSRVVLVRRGDHRLGSRAPRGRPRQPGPPRSARAIRARAPDRAGGPVVEPLISTGHLKGTLNIYREGEEAAFTDEEFLLAKRFGDAAALALDNAHIRARLEHQARDRSADRSLQPPRVPRAAPQGAAPGVASPTRPSRS